MTPEEIVERNKDLIIKWNNVFDKCESSQFKDFITSKIKESEALIKKTIKIHPDKFV